MRLVVTRLVGGRFDPVTSVRFLDFKPKYFRKFFWKKPKLEFIENGKRSMVGGGSMASINLGAMRKAYNGPRNVLLESDIKTRDPFELFEEWFQEVKQTHHPSMEPNAVCLATSTKDGKPSARMVLLKGYDPVNGFTIFTNYTSRKGTEMEENPNVALLFFWDYLSRQIRVEGTARRVPAKISDEYFHSRPLLSQVSARISDQSKPIDSRETLVQRQLEQKEYWLAKQKEQSPDSVNHHPVPRPDFWGGFSIVPTRFEFWQGQSDRLHDRLVFTRTLDSYPQQPQKHSTEMQNGNGNCTESEWSLQRLQP